MATVDLITAARYFAGAPLNVRPTREQAKALSEALLAAIVTIDELAALAAGAIDSPALRGAVTKWQEMRKRIDEDF